MLGLQVGAPLDFILEVVVVLLQQLDGVGVGHAGKVAGCDQLEALDQALVKELVEEGQLVGAVVQQVADDVAGHGLGGLEIGVQVGEGHLGLDHPELGGVAGVVALLGAEGGAERVDVAQRHGHGLGLQLAGNGQVDRTLEEVLRVVNAALVVAGDVVEVKGGHLEHLTGALAVRAGKNRRMHVGKAVLMEELVQGERRLAAHAERSVEGVGAGAQVGHGAQVVHAHLLFLQRIVAAAGAEHGDFIRIDFKGLLGARGHNNAAGDLKARVQTALGDLGIVGELVGLKNDLDGLIAAAVGQRDKADIFRIAHSLGPAADGDLGAVCRGGLVQRCKFRSLHG